MPMHLSRPATIAAASLVLVLVCPRESLAQVESMIVAVEGMTCQLCAINVEKALRRVDGVESARVSVREANADLRMATGASFRLSAISTALTGAGYRMGDVIASARGVVERQNQSLALVIPGAGTFIIGGEGAAAEPFVSQPVRVRGKIAAAPAGGTRIEIQNITRAPAAGARR